MKQQQFLGENKIEALNTILEQEKATHIFLVSGKKSFQQAYLQEKLQPILQKYSYTHFSDFGANPNIEDIKIGIQQYQQQPNAITLAIGGGRVLDTAKLLHFFSQQNFSAEDYFLQQNICAISKPKQVLIAIPTTAGTGSESTQFATIYIDKIKYSLDEAVVLPDYCIIDPNLLANVPSIIQAQSGMDALTQAIESYWSVNSSVESRQYAKQAMELLWPSIKKAVINPDKESQQNMAFGANLAGQAINLSRTTVAHAISYPMTINFSVDHGQAVSISLAHFLEFNSHISENNIQDNRGLHFVQERMKEILKILNCENASELKSKWTQLLIDIGLKTKLSELGIQAKDHAIILEQFNPIRAKNNPRSLSKTELSKILSDIA